ncbi:hypothetical protein RPHASCH2410_CH13650 [Rhizobium phaseoli Ch24-10]|nr:hypothetical protein RPHASCH2410_CH13650 [Rhizobium phaseoli Ch24-10]
MGARIAVSQHAQGAVTMITRASPWIFIRERPVPRTGLSMREGRRHVKNGQCAARMNKFGAKLPEIDAIFRHSPEKISILTMFFSSYQ